MSRSSSLESLETPPPEWAMKYPDYPERGRSLSWNPADKYYVASCSTPGTSRDMYHCGPRDIPKLTKLYHQLLLDNMRLWECVNVIRCNSHRVAAQDVMRKIYSMNDDEFLHKYSSYANFEQGGHGALHSAAPGGGCHEEQKYVLHLLEHNGGLLRENARLKNSLHILTQQPERTADEVVSHVFSLDDENFIKYYPKADRDGRLLAALTKLKEDERRRHRTLSLPGHLVNLALRQRGSSEDRPGPSCAGHKDVSHNRSAPSGWTSHRTQIDSLCGEHHLSPDGKTSAKKPCPVSRFGGRGRSPSVPPEVGFGRSRRLSDSPDSKGGKCKLKADSNRDSERCKHSSGGRHVPYMVSQHPYNWATANNSSSPGSFSNIKRSDCLECERAPPESDFEGRVVYRKHQNPPRLGRRVPLASRQEPTSDTLMNKRNCGPKITFSKSPASASKTHVTKPKAGLNTRNQVTPDRERPRSRTNSTPNYSPLPTLAKHSCGKKPPVTGRTNSAPESSTGKRSLSLSAPKMPPNRHPGMSAAKRPPTPKRPASGAGQAGRSAMFDHSGGHFSCLKTKRPTDGDRICHSNRTPRRVKKEELSEKCRPLYYKPPLVPTEFRPQFEDEADRDFPPPHRHVFRHPPSFTRTRPDKSFWSSGGRTSTPVSDRLSRSLSDDLFLLDDERVLDPNQSRKELLDFRDAYRDAVHSTARVVYPRDISPDSLEPSPLDRGEFAPCQRLNSPVRQNKGRYPDLLLENRGCFTERDNVGSKTFPRPRRKFSNPDLFKAESVNNAAHEPAARKVTRSTPMLPCHESFLSDNKPHRIPTRRPLFGSGSRKSKDNVKTPERTVHQEWPGYPYGYENENTNRDTDTPSSVEYFGNTLEETGHLDLSPRHSSMDTDDSIFNELVREKQVLYEKYHGDLGKSEPSQRRLSQDPHFQDGFEMRGNFLDRQNLRETYPGRTSLRAKYQDSWNDYQDRFDPGDPFQRRSLRDRYQDGSSLHEKHQERSAVHDPYPDRLDLHAEYQDRPDGYQRRSDTNENYCERCEPQGKPQRSFDLNTIHKDDIYQHESQRDRPELDHHYPRRLGLHENFKTNSYFRRRSSSEPSPRMFKHLDLDRQKHLSFVDPVCRTYVSERVRRAEISSDQSRSDESTGDARMDREPYPEAIERLREETQKLKDRTDKCQQDREQLVSRVQVENTLIDAYSHLGRPSRQEPAKVRIPRFLRNRNANATCPHHHQHHQHQRHHHHHYHYHHPICKSSFSPSSLPRSTIPTTLPTLPPGRLPDDVYSNVKAECDDGQSSGCFRTVAVQEAIEEAEAETRSTLEAPLTVLGEVAYQLEGRIIRQVFKDVPSRSVHSEKEESDEERVWTDDNKQRHRFYGFTVQNLHQKIRADCKDPKTGKRDASREARLLRRFQDVIAFLRHNFGYHVHKHGKLCQRLIQQHGVYSVPPDALTIMRLGLNDFRSVRNHVIRLADPEEHPAMLVLVDCLRALGEKEEQPILCFQ